MRGKEGEQEGQVQRSRKRFKKEDRGADVGGYQGYRKWEGEETCFYN